MFLGIKQGNQSYSLVSLSSLNYYIFLNKTEISVPSSPKEQVIILSSFSSILEFLCVPHWTSQYLFLAVLGLHAARMKFL